MESFVHFAAEVLVGGCCYRQLLMKDKLESPESRLPTTMMILSLDAKSTQQQTETDAPQALKGPSTTMAHTHDILIP